MPDGTQKIEDTGPLNSKRMETVDEETLAVAKDFIQRQVKAGKPVGIHRHVGRRPILAFGNSDGDLQMLEWTTAGTGARLGLIVHHDDAERETTYDRKSAMGRLDKGLDEAAQRGWMVVSMKRDWKRVFPAER
jgi:hypothetical protein